ncbi:MAG: hypothetical protein ACRD0J_06570 [Acidimicrobiales bacterium]
MDEGVRPGSREISLAEDPKIEIDSRHTPTEEDVMAVGVNTVGVNINGEGEPIGLWCTPGTVVQDEHDYIFLSPDELGSLAIQILESLSSPGTH